MLTKNVLTGDAGNIDITAGASDDSNGGDVRISSGNGANNAGNTNILSGSGLLGGNIDITAGNSQSGLGGQITLRSGDTLDGDGGDIVLTTGASDNSNGGNVIIRTASALGNGGNINLEPGIGDSDGGYVTIKDPSSSARVLLNPFPITTDRYVSFPNKSGYLLLGHNGSVSQALVAATTITVTIGANMPNTTYSVNVTPTSAISAALFYVTNKTTTELDVVYLAGITGTVTFDWAVFAG